MEGIVMRNIAKVIVGAAIAVSASTAAQAQSSAKSECYAAYGYYGYSYAYCEHNPYGRSSPPDRYYGDDRDLISQDRQDSGQQADREQYSYLYRGYPVRDRDDSRHYPDRGDRDRG
jgi:hypothetical protein